MGDLVVRDVLVLGDAAPTTRDVRVRDGAFAAADGPEAGTPPRTLDGRGRLLVPGLVNAHTHSPLNPLKGTGDALSHPAFMWANQADTAGRTPDEVRLSALLGCIEHLRSGTTAVIDHFPEQGFAAEHVAAVIDAYEIAGLRALVALRVFDEPYDDILPPAGLPPDLAAADPLRPRPAGESLALVEEAVARHDGRAGGRVRVCPGPSNPGRCSDGLLAGVRDLARRRGTPVHMHLLETRRQADLARERHGCTEVERLDRLGLLDERLSCAHSIWLEEGDIALMAERGAVAVHNPESNLKLGAGLAPVARMLRAGVTVALGSDGASTNDGLDLHEAMRLAITLPRPFEPDRRLWPTAADALAMATTAGTRAMGGGGPHGLAPGAPADFVLHDLSAPAWTPLNDPLAQLVFGGTGATVRTVVVGGRVLVEEGAILAFDPAPVLAEARGLVRHLRARNAPLTALAARIAAAVP